MPDRKLTTMFIVSRNVEALIPFYRDTLGLKLTQYEPGHSAWFDTGTVKLAIHTPEEDTGGGDYLPEAESVLWFQPSEGVPLAAEYLARSGLKLMKPRTATNYLFFRDPEGRLLGLHEPRTEEKSG